MKRLIITLSVILFLLPLSAQETKQEPLIIVNGVRTNLKVTNIDPEKIESVNVLKGDAAVAVYGLSGRDGVIQIRTKEVQPTGLNLRPVTDPLIIVDGNEYPGDANTIDVNTISSISVLKNQASVQKYGEKGKNGVIIITTKK